MRSHGWDHTQGDHRGARRRLAVDRGLLTFEGMTATLFLTMLISGGVSAGSVMPATEGLGAQASYLRSILEPHTDHWSDDELDTVARAVDEASRASGIDPHLVLGLMFTESTFRGDVSSSRGARGLLQVMPSTARAFADRAGVEWEGVETLHDLDANVRIGVTYLAYLLERFRGNTNLALAAYCHGPTRVFQLLREHGALPSETTAYVTRVSKHWKRFRVAGAGRAPIELPAAVLPAGMT